MASPLRLKRYDDQVKKYDTGTMSDTVCREGLSVFGTIGTMFYLFKKN
jgi:hypothetical protein